MNTFETTFNNDEQRHALRLYRKKLSLELQKKYSQHICQKILKLPFFQSAHCFAIYNATEGEPNLFSLYDKKKNVLLPCISRDKQLHFFPFTEKDVLHKNRYDILEPEKNNPEVIPQNIDLIIMPLVGFDEYGNRLGRGAGYYDRTLAFMQKNPRLKKPFLMGVGYEFQKIKTITPKPWDIPLHMIVTEKKIYEVPH